jgi:maltose alpha-D-glucosyltransferase/alpha-amylase
MQWTKGKNLGFSTASPEKLYLPIDPTDDAPTVEANEKDSGSLLNRTRRLIQLKHTEPALAAYAEFIPLYAKKNAYPFIFARAKDKDAVIVILNPSGKESSAEFSLNIPFSKLILIAGKEIKVTKDNTKISVIVPKQTYAIYKLIQ